jgi:tight adherence protein B
VVTYLPLAIFAGVLGVAGLIFASFWDAVYSGIFKRVEGASALIDRAGVRVKPDVIAIRLILASVALWAVAAVLLRPNPIIGILLLPAIALMIGAGAIFVLNYLTRRRLLLFVDQLEVTLRLMASSVRVGLGLQQALAAVVREMSEPTKYEFSRLIGRNNIGVPLVDALDDLAERMPAHETFMLAKVIRIQTQTGGNLARILEQLAGTIKERRRLKRKVRALTSEGRIGAIILEVIPIALGVFIVSTQGDMARSLLTTGPGHIVLALIAILEAAMIFTMQRILNSVNL